MFKQLLVPIDGSELATHAITQGLALARQLGASVTGFVVEAMP
ncbi:MAG: universal stress protein, partial [Rhodoferax sp.]|nr:universal stress protein [Rhodoferax sp.]